MATLPVFDKISLDIYEAASRENAESNKARRFSRGKHRRYLGMSQIGKPCSRSLWYDFRSFTPKPFEGRVGLIFNDGNYYEGQVVKYLKLSGYEVTNTGWEDQLEFSAHNDLFKGHADGVIHGIPCVSSKDHILECKSAKASKFKSFQSYGVRKTYPVYYSQCQCYMGYSGLERAVVIVYNKDTSEIYSERIHFKRQEFEALQRRALEIITSNEPPAKISEDPESFECKWCDYRLHCCTEEGIIMADDRVCGSCWYHHWQGLKNCCTHPDHPFFLETWGIGCDDYSFVFDKEMGTHELKRKPRVNLEEVREAQ